MISAGAGILACYVYDYAGQSHAINLSAAAPKPQKVVLAQPRSTGIAVTQATAVNLSKTGKISL